jgi:transcriptional regulator EpsA
MGNPSFASEKMLEDEVEPKPATRADAWHRRAKRKSKSFARMDVPLLQIASFCKSLQFLESKTANAIARSGGLLQQCRAENNDMGADKSNRNTPALAARAFRLTEDEAAKFLRIVSDSLLIRRHYQLFLWLNAELQQFLPHQILISAWGDFSKWNLKLDLISNLPGVRTEHLARCGIDDLVRDLYGRWIAAGRQAVVVKAAESTAPYAACGCAVHSAIRSMHTVLAHGLRDERGGYDSLYITLNTGSFTKGRSKERFLSLLDTLIAQLDVAFRRVTAFPFEESKSPLGLSAHGVELSLREQAVLDCVCRGKTNIDIAMELDISPFTVKNHVQRIFRKIGVSNRTQAAAKYNDVVRGAGST